MSHLLRYAVNHAVAPRKSFAELVALTQALGLDAVEMRNDLPATAILDGTDPAQIRDQAQAGGVRILSINALQRFNEWNTEREVQARMLARYAQDCGAAMVVLCPVNDVAYRLAESERLNGLRLALRALAPILADAGVIGLVEPLGFQESSLRLKSEAVEAIEDQGVGDRFRIVHDTFHHYLSGEPHLLPDWTGLVHLSGVDDPHLPLSGMRDAHRGLVGAADRLGNIAQIIALLAGGYDGRFSFEPFAASVQTSRDVGGDLARSIHWLDAELAKAQV
ncbi:MAG TPA: TIM barrel protein [Geminicoccaceae bacterium]|nr:TIM barrel protein [Geminicoccaceae bacterium]